MTGATIQSYRHIKIGEGACGTCDEVHPLTDRHGQPSFVNRYGVRQRAWLVPVHGPRDNRCAGGHHKPKPWLEASGLPAWDALSDLDKGAALMHVWKRKREGAMYAREHYPVRYSDHPALPTLDDREACRHASVVAGTWDEAKERLGEHELDRLYGLALAVERS